MTPCKQTIASHKFSYHISLFLLHSLSHALTCSTNLIRYFLCSLWCDTAKSNVTQVGLNTSRPPPHNFITKSSGLARNAGNIAHNRSWLHIGCSDTNSNHLSFLSCVPSSLATKLNAPRSYAFASMFGGDLAISQHPFAHTLASQSPASVPSGVCGSSSTPLPVEDPKLTCPSVVCLFWSCSSCRHSVFPSFCQGIQNLNIVHSIWHCETSTLRKSEHTFLLTRTKHPNWEGCNVQQWLAMVPNYWRWLLSTKPKYGPAVGTEHCFPCSCTSGGISPRFSLDVLGSSCVAY